MTKPIVGIIMGSDSDLSVMQDTAKVFEDFKIDYEITVCSAHRTPDRAHEYSATAESRGLKVIIAAAGGAAHLAGVISASTTIPVIGVPIQAKTLDGLDSLLSTVQMPPGIPVATVGINAAKNAGLLAVKILAINNENLKIELKKYAEKMKDGVNKKAEKLERIGYKKYLEETK